MVSWPVPVADFRLWRLRLESGRHTLELTPDGPRTVLCLRGQVNVADKRGQVRLAGGESAFGPADGGSMTFDGTGEIYLASLVDLVWFTHFHSFFGPDLSRFA